MLGCWQLPDGLRAYSVSTVVVDVGGKPQFVGVQKCPTFSLDALLALREMILRS